MKWKEVSGVMCDRKMPVKLKDKVFKTIIRPAMTYGSECWAVKKKDVSKLNSAEMRMLRWARGKTRLDHIRNEDIRKEADVKPVETFLENKSLKWPWELVYGFPERCKWSAADHRCIRFHIGISRHQQVFGVMRAFTCSLQP